MGIILNSITGTKQLDCEFFRVECTMVSNASADTLPSYFLFGESMKGEQIIIEILSQTEDVSAIRKLCNKAEEYGKQASLQYEIEKQEVESQILGNDSEVEIEDR